MLGRINSYKDFMMVYRSKEALWRHRRLNEFQKEDPDRHKKYMHRIKNDSTKNGIMGYGEYYQG